jgi:hypothetical protein
VTETTGGRRIVRFPVVNRTRRTEANLEVSGWLDGNSIERKILDPLGPRSESWETVSFPLAPGAHLAEIRVESTGDAPLLRSTFIPFCVGDGAEGSELVLHPQSFFLIDKRSKGEAGIIPELPNLPPGSSVLLVCGVFNVGGATSESASLSFLQENGEIVRTASVGPIAPGEYSPATADWVLPATQPFTLAAELRQGNVEPGIGQRISRKFPELKSPDLVFEPNGFVTDGTGILEGDSIRFRIRFRNAGTAVR